jgi:tetratricopeptide (TPR) repeat protein
MRRILRCLVAAACFLGVVSGSSASARNPLAKPKATAAREHLERGNRLYDTRAFDEAIVEYKAGALVEPAPVFDFNLGQAYRQLGRYQDALWHYDRFLRYGEPMGELLDAVNGFMTEMRAQLANRAPTMPPTGPAANDGSAFASTARPPDRVIPRSEAERNDRAEQLERASAPESAASPYWLGWTTLGTGVVAAGASGLLLWRASSLHDQANTEPDVRRRVEVHDHAKTRTVIGAVVGVGGAVLTATGAVLLVTHSRARARIASWDIGISAHGVEVFGRF